MKAFNINKLEYASIALFFIVIFTLSAACEQSFLYALHNYSQYLDSDPFRSIIFSYGAGSLSLISRYITQYFISPVFGAFAVSATLTAIYAMLLKKISRQTNAKKIGLAAVPSLTLFVAIYNLEYLLFDKVDGSIIMSILLGSLISVLLAAWMQVENKISLYLSIVVTEFSYFAIGMFSPLAMLIGAASYIKRDNKIAMMLAGIGLASWFGFNYITSNLLHYEEYAIALFAPLYVSHSSTFFFYTLIAMALMIVYPILANRCVEETEITAKKFISPGLAFAITMVIAKLCCYNDENYHKILQLQQLEDEENWEEMTKVAKSANTPTIDIYAYYLESLIANGEKVNKMFDFPTDWVSHNTSNFTLSNMIYYPDFAFATGNYNISLFHSMEFYQLTGENFRRIKRMMQCAIMTEEPELAEKYLAILETSSVYSDYAKEWRKYIGNKAQLLNDRSAYKNFDSYYEPRDEWFVSNTITDFVTDRTDITNYKVAEARLLANMFLKDLRAFSNDIRTIAPIYKGNLPPKCIQQAACLCAISGDMTPVKSIMVDRTVAEEAQKFAATAKKAGKNSKEKLEEYKGSYLYFYTFKNVNNKNYKGGGIVK